MPEDELHEMCRPAKTNRVILIVGAAAAILIASILLIRSPPLNHHEKAPPPAPIEKSELVDLFDVRWVGGGAGAILQDQTQANQEGVKLLVTTLEGEELKGYSLARIIEQPGTNILEFNGTACAFSFGLKPRPGIPWVRIDGIDIVVENYRALPEYDPIIPSLDQSEKRNVHYVEIDKPEVAKTNIFSASLIVGLDRGIEKVEGKPVVKKLEFARLTEGTSEQYVVRLNAKTPGIYRFSCVVRLSDKDSESKQTVISSATYAFGR